MAKILASIIFVLGTAALAEPGLYRLTSNETRQNCHIVPANQQGDPGLKYTVCEEKAKADEVHKPFLIAKSTYQELPEFIKLQFAQKSEEIKNWEQIYISISTENDDLVLFGLCKARESSCSDDVGYTVGSAITLGGVYQGKYDVQMTVANALYSKAVPGTTRHDEDAGVRSSDQYIRSAVLLEFLINSARQNNLYYWSLGSGMIALSSQEKFGIFDAAKQQRSLHHVLNSLGHDLAVQNRNVDDGQPDQWGFYLLAGLGVQKFLKSADGHWNSRGYAQITTRVSTLAKHNELRVEVGADVGRRVGEKGRAAVGGSLATALHDDGRVNEASVYIKYESGKKWDASLGFVCPRGRLENFATYNIPNVVTGKPECHYRLAVKYYME